MSDTNTLQQNSGERVDVFLSSRQDDDKARTLRKNIFDLADELGLSVWQPPPKPPNTSADEILEECLYYLTKADLYICILVDTYGTNQEALANLSILELEIFHAVLSQKTPYFFAIKPFEPSKQLSTLLDALEIISPGLIKYCKPEEALQRIKDILENLRWLWLSQQLARLRSNFSTGRENHRRDTNEEALSAVFLNGSFVPFAFKAEPDENLIRRLVEKAARTSHEPTKLVYLWAAVRNLSMAPYDRISDPLKLARFVPLWDKVLSRWASAAAWAGFHGRHLTLGRLPAVNTLLKLREYGSAHGLPARGQVNGAIASEYYSLAKQVRLKRRRRELFNQALEQVTLGLEKRPKDPSGLLLIKGSVLLGLGRVQEAVLTYEAACTHREQTRASDGVRGEAYAELGFAYLQQGRLIDAQRQLESGVALIKQSNRSTGFKVRAIRKLGEYYLRSWHPLRALREINEAYNLAAEAGFDGQITFSMRVIHWICNRRFPFRARSL